MRTSLMTISTVALIVTLGTTMMNCQRDLTAQPVVCSPTSQTDVEAKEQSVGYWRLTSIKSGWTSNVRKPEKVVEMSIDDQQKVIVYEDNQETSRFQLVLRSYENTVRYSVANQSSSPSSIIFREGRLSVCPNLLVIDNTDLDGSLYTYEKVQPQKR